MSNDATPPTAAQSPAPTIHAAEPASGASGAVEYGPDIDEATAVQLRKNGLDIVVRGNETDANRRLAWRIESQVGPPTRPQHPHLRSAGPLALPHFHQLSGSPKGHSFYETDQRKARRKP